MGNTISKLKVGIGVPTLFPYIHKLFFDSFLNLNHPCETILIDCTGSITAIARNRIVKVAKEQKCTHILFLDADMTFPTDVIPKLLKHNVDIACGLYKQRNEPHKYALFRIKKGEYIRPEIEEGLMKVDAAGTGCMLINMKLFDKIDFPWFDYRQYRRSKTKYFTEDIWFCKKAREKGFKIYVDTDVKCGHIIDKILEV